MGLPELKADAKLHHQRLMKIAEGDLAVKNEIALNIWPFLESLLEEVVAMDEAIEELINQSENILHPELTAKIVGVFQAGKILCGEIDKVLPSLEDDLQKKRITEIMTGYLRGCEVVTEEIMSVTLDLSDDDDEETSFDAAAKTSIKPEMAGPGDEEDEDDLTDDIEEVTPVEIPRPSVDPEAAVDEALTQE